MAEHVIHWFRRDLRLEHNNALDHALDSGAAVIPVFILDEVVLGQPTMGDRRLQLLRTALIDLDGQLRRRGSRLLVRRSEDAVRELNRLATETGAWAVYFNRDFTPYARQRDTRATRGLQMTGVVTMAFDDLLLVQPYQTIDAEGHLPSTFRAFSRRWFSALDVDPVAPRAAPGNFAPSEEMPASSENWQPGLAPRLNAPSAWPGATPAGARARLAEFLEVGLDDYAARRDFAADEEGTSRLSAALKFGTISVREVAAAVLAAGAARPEARVSTERFISELAWREFAHHLLFARPELLSEPMRRPSWVWSRDPDPAALEAWTNGQTGLPMVDAGMRQLLQTGWMHNRVRMLTASFLAHQLGGDWRAGERHFARHLVDYDVASNDLGWQWAVGTGVDAAPYRRTFNPRVQGERFDPDGLYVKQWVPELRALPASFIHHPWDAGPIDYPEPVAPPAMPRKPPRRT